MPTFGRDTEGSEAEDSCRLDTAVKNIPPEWVDTLPILVIFIHS